MLLSYYSIQLIQLYMLFFQSNSSIEITPVPTVKSEPSSPKSVDPPKEAVNQPVVKIEPKSVNGSEADERLSDVKNEG